MVRVKKLMLILGLTLVAALGLLGLAACKKTTKPPAAVDPLTIAFDGTLLTWGASEGASSYIVDVNGVQNACYGPQYTCSIASTVDVVNVSVKAKNDAGESEAAGKQFTRIPTINADSFRFDEVTGELSWDNVEGAVSYIVEINGKQINNGASNIFSNFEYGQNNVIRVRAVGGEGTFSSFGTSATKTYLGAPADVRYDGEVITWRGSTQAKSYELYINNNLIADGLTGGRYEYTADNTQFTIALKSIGDGINSFSSPVGEEITCTKLDEVRNISVENGALIWDPVEFATAYEVRLNNGAAQRTSECSFSISSGVNYRVEIKPLAEESDHYFSVWSAPANVYILNAPTLKWNSGLSLDGEAQNAVSWDNSANAGGYTVRVITPSGAIESYDAITAAPHLAHAFLETGVYEVSVSALSADAGIYPSAYSEPLYIRRLAAPKLLTSNAVTSTSNSYESGFKVDFIAAESANTYSIYKEGNLLSTSQNTSFTVTSLLDENQGNGGEIEFTIRSFGQNSGNNIELPSLTSSATQFTVTVLPTPDNIVMSGNAVGWDALTGAQVFGYAVRVDASSASAQNNSYALQSIEPGEHTVSVCATGNGQAILPSPYSQSIKVRKLEAPANIRVNTSNDDGRLAWDNVLGATSFLVYFNGSSTGIDATQMENINTQMQSGGRGVSVVMEAVANYYDTDGTYILSSDKSQTKQFIKLYQVDASSAHINGYELTWNPPSNISQSASGLITYRVYDDNNTLIDTVDTTRLDLSDFEGRLAAYAFTIRCVGDGQEFFNSELSDPIQVTKLQSVSLSVSATKDGYTWNGVANATAYRVRINDEIVATVTHNGTGAYTLSSEKFAAYMAAPGQYQVSLVAVGNPSAMIMDSSTFVRTQTVNRLSTPELAISYSEERVSPTGNIIVTVQKEIPNANGYAFAFNGVAGGAVDGLTCSYNAPTAGGYEIVSVANGGMFDENGVFYCDSLNSDAKTITLLGTPSSDTIVVTKDNVLQWDAVTGATALYGYTLELTYADGSSDTVKSDYATYQIAAGKTLTSVRICANGNGSTTITSAFVEKNII